MSSCDFVICGAGAAIRLSAVSKTRALLLEAGNEMSNPLLPAIGHQMTTGTAPSIGPSAQSHNRTSTTAEYS